MPKNINLQAATPALTKFAIVTLVNQSTHSETISNLAALVTLTAQALTNCPDAQVVLHAGPPNPVLPVTWLPKKKLNVFFDVSFSTNCVPDPWKGIGHKDYRYTATVHHTAIDDNADTKPANDVCPRPANPATGDKGCAKGLEVLTDVFIK